MDEIDREADLFEESGRDNSGGNPGRTTDIYKRTADEIQCRAIP